ncbi:MAG: tetratricopeptide repeat protein [Armatimonadetes bacterium]|nr:tetratricopeptide repeat protein [Armatimonadota bacterium]MDW8121724.1 tetratricopeptide repeat protein [Armatimonadota bacterium]
MEFYAEAIAQAVRLSALLLTVGFVGIGVISRIIDGSFSGEEAAIGLLFVAVLLVGVVFLWDRPLVFVLLLAGGALVALWTLSRSRAEKKWMSQQWEEDAARYRKTLERDPKNAAAWSALGDLYLEKGQYQDAVACYEKAVELVPTDSTEKAKLSRAKRKLEESQGKGRFCPDCKNPVPRTVLTCPHCGFELSAPFWVWIVEAARDPKAWKKGAIAFVVSFCLLTVYVFLLTILPPIWRAFLLLSTMLAIAIVIWIEIRL